MRSGSSGDQSTLSRKRSPWITAARAGAVAGGAGERVAEPAHGLAELALPRLGRNAFEPSRERAGAEAGVRGAREVAPGEVDARERGADLCCARRRDPRLAADVAVDPREDGD